MRTSSESGKTGYLSMPYCRLKACCTARELHRANDLTVRIATLLLCPLLLLFFAGGYILTDLTGDNFVDGTDFLIADTNAANFVSVVRP